MTIDPSILLNAMCEVDVLLVFTCLLPFTIVTGQCHVSQTCQTCGISCIPGDVLFLVRIADTRRKIINTALMSRIFLVIEHVGQPVPDSHISCHYFCASTGKEKKPCRHASYT